MGAALRAGAAWPVAAGPGLVDQLIAHQVVLLAPARRHRDPGRAVVVLQAVGVVPEAVERAARRRREIVEREAHVRQRVEAARLRRPVGEALAVVALAIQVLVEVEQHIDAARRQQLHHAVDAVEVAGVDHVRLRHHPGEQHAQAHRVEAVRRQPVGIGGGEAVERIRSHVRRLLPNRVDPVQDHRAALRVDQPGAVAAQLVVMRRSLRAGVSGNFVGRGCGLDAGRARAAPDEDPGQSGDDEQQTKPLQPNLQYLSRVCDSLVTYFQANECESQTFSPGRSTVVVTIDVAAAVTIHAPLFCARCHISPRAAPCSGNSGEAD